MWTLLVIAAILAVVVILLPRRDDHSLPGMVDALLRAALDRYPDDPALLQARRTIRDVQDFGDEPAVDRERMLVRLGRFDRDAGVLRINTRTVKDQLLPPDKLRATVVHEVAHATQPDGEHSPQWRDMYVRLLEVATEGLGWQVTLNCEACRFYDVCGPTDCPKCARQPCYSLTSSKFKMPGVKDPGSKFYTG